MWHLYFLVENPRMYGTPFRAKQNPVVMDFRGGDCRGADDSWWWCPL